MNKQAILQANNEQLNTWCATKIWEWGRVTKQANSVYEDSMLFWVRANDEIEAWLYEPTVNPIQALALLNRVASEWRIEGNTKGQWSVSLKSNRGDPTTERIKWYHGEANSMAKAIVLACLSAVAEDGEA